MNLTDGLCGEVLVKKFLSLQEMNQQVKDCFKTEQYNSSADAGGYKITLY